jgi:hypothetical protein
MARFPRFDVDNHRAPLLGLSLTIIIESLMSLWAADLDLPSRPLQTFFELFSGDAAFCGDHSVGQHDWDAPVVQAEELVVGVDIGELGLVAELPEQDQGLIAEVAALAGDQDQLHEAEPSAAG